MFWNEIVHKGIWKMLMAEKQMLLLNKQIIKVLTLTCVPMSRCPKPLCANITTVCDPFVSYLQQQPVVTQPIVMQPITQLTITM